MAERIYIPGSGSSPDPQRLGGKGANLAIIADTGHDVPPWFAITTDALESIPGVADASTAEAARDAVRNASLPADLLEDIEAAIDRLNLSQEHLAVRSSAVGEDGEGLSYAGQLESFLFVPPDEAAEFVRKVWLSAFSDRVAEYRNRNGLPEPVPGVSVIVQQMLCPEVSGVAFGVDPLTGDTDTVVISSLYGLGEGLVSGQFDADRFQEKNGSIESIIADKPEALAYDVGKGSGTTVVSVPDDRRGEPSLTDSQVREIAEATRCLNRTFGSPQDVEWSYAGGRLFILQSRPVTAVAAAESGARVIWDNSNIIESYSGVTTPMTFSFIDGVYTEVYKELTRILGVAPATIAANERVFRMLGLIRGHVYYNLLNWYRVLALLPGYRVNAGFMEGMMGVRERLEQQPDIVPPEGNQVVRLAVSVYRLIANLIRLPKAITTFHGHLNRTLEPFEGKDLSDMTPDDLIRAYRHLERELLQRWRTPILNDFYTMIFHGLLKKMIESWKIPGGETLHNDLLIGEGEIISTEPIRRLREIADVIRSRPGLADRIESTKPTQALEALRADRNVAPLLESYLGRFGDRYAGELRLETITPSRKPELVIELIRGYVRAERHSDSEGAATNDLRQQAEQRAFGHLKGHPIRRALFRKVLSLARERVKNRENLRFERTRVFAVVRNIVLGLGGHLAERGLLERDRDVFYLGIDELFSLVDGTGLSADPAGIVEARRKEFARYRNLPAPPDRFETHGIVAGTSTFQTSQDEAESDGDTIRGTACCPGVVTGPVRIVRDPSEAVDLRGHILVAERTDPGWAPLFPLATGLLVERGSLLSHSAIVAREMGIPAVVAVPNLLNRLRDGETVTMDGAAGTIHRHESNDEGPSASDSSQEEAT